MLDPAVNDDGALDPAFDGGDGWTTALRLPLFTWSSLPFRWKYGWSLIISP